MQKADVKLKEIAEILEAQVIDDFGNEDLQVNSACSADMMSAVLSDSLLITGLTQPHVIRTAEIAGIKIIVFVLDKKPDAVTIEMAREKNIPLLSTPLCMYTASGRLFQAGIPGCLNK
jgi:hypothetical protein